MSLDWSAEPRSRRDRRGGFRPRAWTLPWSHGPARANRRNNPQTGSHAFKTIFGDEIYHKNATEQRNEILGMTLAYSLTRLIHLEVDRGIQAVFAPGARILASARLLALDELRSAIPSRSRVKPELT